MEKLTFFLKVEFVSFWQSYQKEDYNNVSETDDRVIPILCTDYSFTTQTRGTSKSLGITCRIRSKLCFVLAFPHSAIWKAIQNIFKSSILVVQVKQVPRKCMWLTDKTPITVLWCTRRWLHISVFFTSSAVVVMFVSVAVLCYDCE